MIGGSTAEAELASLSPWARPAPAIARAERDGRLARAREGLGRMGADALLVNAGPSLRYLTGVGWGATERLVALLLPASGQPILICPAFELGSLQAELAIDSDIRLWEEDESPTELVADALAPGATLALDPLLNFGAARRLGERLRIVDGAAIIDGLRMRKSPAELALMQQAKDMTLEVHRRAARILAPGIRASEVKRFIDAAHRALGASGSFFCAVQFGYATAFPHGLPGDQQLEEKQLVLIDTGCTIEGYHSDITRTYAFGAVSDEVRDLWALEKAAQAAAFEAAKPGETCESVDHAARAVLEKAGLGPDYRLPGLPHRTGHGIGLAIHEPAYLVRGDRTLLAEGMCFSNEPMIVVPNRFGIRLEDHFHVTATGAKWFTEPQVSLERPFS
ncbi:Xaa-Pro peptidase family protein [Sandaracinobacter sp. RS1-74]|uniref:M24 family metallopeptidase n=1 Tax=Sandaracinobacteroides sayramensis TaxID=2913411 RepID=UPI001EDAE546|nr:Xaa-Pro peptidase family protein [Sandaracinobacteroides sayramensis]MCG2839437.1 Xaa-Pro peptidase family protein [Sandaracinobacteroides sayramensis]